MKKFLLLFTILCTGILANAAEVTFDMTNPESFGLTAPAKDGRIYPESLTYSTVNIAVDFNKASNTSRLCFLNNGSITYRCSANGGKSNQKLTFSTTDGSNITKIVFTATNFAFTVSPGTLTEKVWEGNAANVTFTTTGQCVITKIVVTTANGGTPVEPVAPSDLTVKYGETSVSDDDEVSVTEGTEFNISAKDAAKITVTDLEDNVLASADASKLTWTPEVMAENIITVTASNEKGNVSTVFSLTVTEKPFTAIDAIDVLTVKSFNGINNTYGVKTSNGCKAEYKGFVNTNNANSNQGIAANQIVGIRSNNNTNGGIVTTSSVGYALKVSATQWEKQDVTGRSLIVWGQNTPYTVCQPANGEYGEMLGEIALEKGVEKSLILANGYKYIAIMPEGGACQLSEIKIQWASEKPALPEGGLDFTIDDTAFEIEADAESVEIIVTGVHAESDLYYKFTATPAETAPESAPRKIVNHEANGYTKAERNSEGNHAISVSEAGTLELYAYHPATDRKSDVKTITVTKQSDTTAIDAIGADTAEGEAEYFNLQGVRINPENAAPGLYIRRQGGKAAKVLVKK